MTSTGVVGYVDLTSNSVEDDVIRLKRNRKFVGVRKILDLSEEGWIERDDVGRGMEVLARHNLTYDLLVREALCVVETLKVNETEI